MSWECPSCGFDGNDDGTMRCSCGHENLIYEPPNYNKIDGGLVFVASGLVLSVCTILSSFSDAVAFAKGEDKSMLLILGTMLVIIPMTLLVLLLKRKRSFPCLFKLWYIFDLILTYLNFMTIKASPNIPGKIEKLNNAIDALALTFIGCCIWLIYFSVSVRVKRTFVR